MKLDLEYINSIFEAIENHEQAQIRLDELLASLQLDRNSNTDIDKLAGHLKVLRDASFVASAQQDIGIIVSKITPGSYTVDTNTRYELTLAGHQLLDAMRNNSLMDKIKVYLKEEGISALKAVPAYLIGIATECILKGHSNG